MGPKTDKQPKRALTGPAEADNERTHYWHWLDAEAWFDTNFSMPISGMPIKFSYQLVYANKLATLTEIMVSYYKLLKPYYWRRKY